MLKTQQPLANTSTSQGYIRMKELINTHFSSMSPDIVVGEQEMLQDASWPSSRFFRHCGFNATSINTAAGGQA